MKLDKSYQKKKRYLKIERGLQPFTPSMSLISYSVSILNEKRQSFTKNMSRKEALLHQKQQLSEMSKSFFKTL